MVTTIGIILAFLIIGGSGMKSKKLIQRIRAIMVFKVANSALYGDRQNIDAIIQVIVIMGLKNVKIITLFKNTYERISPQSTQRKYYTLQNYHLAFQILNVKFALINLQ